MQPTTAQILICLRKNPCARNFLYQNTAIVDKLNSKQLETSTFYPDSFPVARNFVIDRWNSELAYSVVDFRKKPASTQRGMRSEHVTQSNGVVVQKSSIRKLPIMETVHVRTRGA